MNMNSCELSPDQVKQRFRWAKQQGNPAWLWPEVPVGDWREALANIECAVRHRLSGRADAVLAGDGAVAIGLAAYTSGTGPLLGWWIERNVISANPAVAELLGVHLQHNRRRAARLGQEAAEVVGALAGHGIDPIVLKGAHTAHYFPDPATRPVADVDLLVPAEEFRRAEALLEHSGFVRCGRGTHESSWRPVDMRGEPRSLHYVHADDPWAIDLHSSLDIVVADGIPEAQLDRIQPWSNPRPWRPCRQARVLSQPQLLLHLAVHAGATFHNLTLIRLVELRLVIDKDFDAGTWDQFLKTGRRAECLGFAYPALRLCEQLVSGTIPETVLEECRRFVPPAVLRVLAPLSPATAQRVDRASIAEHYMWSRGWKARLRQFSADLMPSGSASDLRSIYSRRAWQLLRGRLTR